MGRTIAHIFFHPYEAIPRKNYIKPANWKDENPPFYFDEIPIFLSKIYRSIDIKLEHECKSLIPSQQCLPIIVVSGKFIDELKLYIRNSKRYESVSFNIKYNEKLPYLLNLVISHKYFMNYLHIPKKEEARWFCEGRFFTLEEIMGMEREINTIPNNINKFVEEKKINYNDFLEEWVGLIFHLTTEYLLFKKKLKVIFFSCDKCCRPALFIKDKTKEGEDDSAKIWGTINMVDTIIFNCQNNMKLSEKYYRSKNNVIYYDETFISESNEVSKEIDILKNETDGAFILTTGEEELNNLLKEIKNKKFKISGEEVSYKFDLILKGSNPEKILKDIETLNAEDNFDRICFYKNSNENYDELRTKYRKIQGKYNASKQLKEFIHLKNQDSEIYTTIKLITFDEYNSKYKTLHKLISSYYGKNEENCFKIAISFLKDFLLWNPKLKLETGSESKIEVLLKILQKFQGLNDNEENIVKIYTQENGSYYQDFNNWLMNEDPLALDKTSWFIAAVMYSFNTYGKNKRKGLKNSLQLYRGIKSNLSDLLYYERAKDKLICFPSFTSTSKIRSVAENFAKGVNENQYKTIITINYIYKNGFVPTAIDISEISKYPKEKECLFLPYSFFKVKNFEIDHSIKEANIELDTIGKKEIIEESLKKGCELAYNEEGGFMEVIGKKENNSNLNSCGCGY